MSANDLTTVPTPVPATAAPSGDVAAGEGRDRGGHRRRPGRGGLGLRSVERGARARRRRRDADQDQLLLESRAQVLDSQLSLYAANFGSAAQHLEYAKPPLAEASSAMRDGDLDELATKVDAALQQVMAARDLAAKLSLDANGKAGEASKLLADVLSALPR